MSNAGSDTFDITAVSKLKHAELWRASKKLGSQSALARHLGIEPSTLGKWINLRKCPSRRFGAERLASIEQKLLDLTGKLLDELFPEELRQAEKFLATDKVIEQTKGVHLDALLAYAEHTRERLTVVAPNDDSQINASDLKETITQALRYLTSRERDVLSARYGLDGADVESLPELGRRYGIGKERIRQIERKALRKVYRHAGGSLSCFLDHPLEYDCFICRRSFGADKGLLQHLMVDHGEVMSQFRAQSGENRQQCRSPLEHHRKRWDPVSGKWRLSH